jgi:hypothetical protein
MDVYTKLSQVQQELHAPKKQFNNFGNYNYRSCEDILEAVKPLLAKHRLVLTMSDDVLSCGERVYIVARGILRDIESGTFCECSANAREAVTKKGMDDSQITGAASSYARKYMLNGLFAIDDAKDADSQKPALPEPTESEIQKVIRMIDSQVTVDGVKDVYTKHIYPRFDGEARKRLVDHCSQQKAEIQAVANENNQ